MTKGNIVANSRYGWEGIVLNVAKSGRIQVRNYGRDSLDWYPADWFVVKVDGNEQCWKCAGTGRFYFSGAVVNGVFQGQTGDCFCCGGKGTCDNADRLRNHYYWQRGSEDVRPSTPEECEVMQVVAREGKAAAAKQLVASPAIESAREDARQSAGTLVDCGDCGCLHRTDVRCPW